MNYLNYEGLLNEALLSVVKKVLTQVADVGLIGAHHFYITFRTTVIGVKIPNFLLKQYPDTLTIVLQHEYNDLKVNDDNFEVTLSFNNSPYHIVIPFNSLITFLDPSINFALSFIPSLSSNITEFSLNENITNINIQKRENHEQNEVSQKTKDDKNIISFSDFKNKNFSKYTPDDIA